MEAGEGGEAEDPSPYKDDLFSELVYLFKIYEAFSKISLMDTYRCCLSYVRKEHWLALCR